MTNDDILRMAHLAGYIGSYADGGHGEQRFDFSKEQLIEFAALVKHATIEHIKHPPRTEHNRYSDIISDGGMDPRDCPRDKE